MGTSSVRQERICWRGGEGSARGSFLAVPASGGPGPQEPREHWVWLRGCQASGQAGDGQSSLHLGSRKGPGPQGPVSGKRAPKVEVDTGFRRLEQGGCPRREGGV